MNCEHLLWCRKLSKEFKKIPQFEQSLLGGKRKNDLTDPNSRLLENSDTNRLKSQLMSYEIDNNYLSI